MAVVTRRAFTVLVDRRLRLKSTWLVSATTNLVWCRHSGGWVVSGCCRLGNVWWWQLVEGVFDEVASAAGPGLVCVGELVSGE